MKNIQKKKLPIEIICEIVFDRYVNSILCQELFAPSVKKRKTLKKQHDSFHY